MEKVVLPLLFLLSFLGNAQHHSYTPPSDPLVQEKLEQWKDLKFGLFMHWGTYSQWGIVESWSLCPEDEGWTVRRGPYANDYFGYRKAYEDLKKHSTRKNSTRRNGLMRQKLPV